MDSSEALKYPIRTFRLAGALPMESAKYPLLFHIWTLFIFLILGILFPLSQILNVFFAESIIEMVDRSIITSSVVLNAFKAVNLYRKRNGLIELFKEFKKLDDEVKEMSHISQMQFAIKTCHQLYFVTLFAYISTCVMLVFQTIFSSPEVRLWSSTYAYPFEWAHEPRIYVTGLFIHGISNTSMVIFAIAADTYGVCLIHILSTHIGILQERLKCLGTTEHSSPPQRLNDLIYCCKSYENILRCSDIIEDILGPALFAQFGVSEVVLCVSAYQLTVISPDNISKLSFVILYFMCMLTEIFVPCYFGSSALEKSKRIAGNIYESNWIEQDKKYKQAFRLFVERTFYPVHIYVHKVFLLDLQTFLKILKTAYSLFALLKNV